ncbi:MAG: polyprenyl synthetase family protein [Firmicutes bacterium]|nr:polyprenyl synthetase family protein [Bacillota bacterium]
MRENYDEYRELVEKHLLDFIPEIDQKSDTIYRAMKYSLTAGGKRLRPVLLMASCEFAGGDAKDALAYACAVEYIHTYSLIHDDLPAMDDDDLRRGRPTSHKVFGEGMAVLAGDALLHTAFEAMAGDVLLHFDDESQMKRRISAMYELAKASGVRGMVAGQVADVENENMECSNAMLEYIHLNKTAALIIGAVRAGLHLGGADDLMVRDMSVYAENLGLAFQIADDILDVTGTTEELGKNVGQDEKGNKNTYVSVNGIEAAKKRLKELTSDAVRAIGPYYDNADFFRTLALKLADRTK